MSQQAFSTSLNKTSQKSNNWKVARQKIRTYGKTNVSTFGFARYKKQQKRGYESPMKTGQIAAHENQHVSDITEQSAVHSLEFEKLLVIL